MINVAVIIFSTIWIGFLFFWVTIVTCSSGDCENDGLMNSKEYQKNINKNADLYKDPNWEIDKK